jgi:DEAD/DEAH box helicase domain-containing protein
MTLHSLFSRWRSDPDTAPNIHTWRTTPPRPAQICPFPADFPAELAGALRSRGISSLYSHQAEAWTYARCGENVALATGTASGKTLGYNLPVLAKLLENAEARALYLFPTKALTQDQLSALGNLLSAISQTSAIAPAIYDGDTPQSQRSTLRKNSRIIFTNPDMLHTGILPHHTNWADFLSNLRFVVIDEMHSYRGVFGSHVANVIRRLKRVADYYGSQPQFILTSATIGNPAELAERLIEAPVTLVEEDGSGRGERHFVIFNPPVVDEALGLRKNSIQESVRLAQDLLRNNLQSVVFARSRRSVEILLKYLQESGSARTDEIRGYRSGYLPRQRREIEKGLRDGSVKMVVATNALELGIDIGGLGAALLVGYPGTIASTIQQAGRAGRGDDPAIAILVATANPLDQFLAHHPEYFFARSPEQALINPDHLLILLNHLRCAMFELPFHKGEIFGGQPVEDYLDFLVSNQESHLSKDQYFWMADAYPAAGVSLRSASPTNILLRSDQGGESTTIGEIDLESAPWMVHPHAVYLHEGQQYFVQDLNFERNSATLIPVALDYYTEPLRETDVSLIHLLDDKATPIATKAYGELQVTTQVKGFRKRMWLSGDNIGEESLDLPPAELQTTGYWIAISEETVSKLAKEGLWTNAPNDYGPEWPKIRERIRARDGYRCQVCGLLESGAYQRGDDMSPERNLAGTKPARQPGDDVSPERNLAGTKPARQHDVHHKIPFRQFRDETGRILRERANRPDNLITLCPECHKKAEQNVRMRSGLAGLSTVLGQLAPLFLMCDAGDLGVHSDPQAAFADGLPSVVLFDQVPAGIGFSQKLFEIHDELMKRALELVIECPCEDGCPSCVGPAGENGVGGKQETVAILKELIRQNTEK